MRILCRPAAAALALGALTLGACGGDDGADSSSPVASTLVDRTSTTAAPAVGTPTTTDGSGTTSLRVTRLVQGLEQPVAMAAIPGTSQLFVVERVGRLRLAELTGDELVVDPTPVLDLSDRILSQGGEQGLLGVAVSPDGGLLVLDGTFTTKGEGGESRVLRYRLDGTRPDPGTETVILRQPQPFWNHNGGHVEFGPDGLLYVGFGDGGGQGDPDGNGQDLGTLLGKILRIDAAASTADRIAIPADNPFAGRAGSKAEIWAYGLRNPWRFSFDRVTGDLWIGDVGGNLEEEIDHAPAADGAGRGANYGWQLREGRGDTATDGDRSGLVDPVIELSHSEGYCSVIGGVVSRDPRLPDLSGSYVFTDACRGELHVLTDGRLRLDAGAVVAAATTFATGPHGEILVATLHGDVYRVDAA